MVENLTKMADQQPRYQVLLFLLKAASPPSTIWQQLNTVNEVNTAPPYVGLIVQIFFHQKAPGLTLSIQQHRSYLQYVLILSEPEPLCLDKLIAETLPLLEAPPVVCLVHLQKLLCGVTVDCSSSLNNLPLKVLFRQETRNIPMVPCVWSFVADAPAECGGWPTSAAQVLPSARVCCDLKTQQIITSWPIR